MKRLTETEIEEFKRIVAENIPILEKILKNRRELVSSLRIRKMTDENLALLEIATESMCKIYLVKKTWGEMKDEELLWSTNDALCDYVRTVIRLFKNMGEKHA